MDAVEAPLQTSIWWRGSKELNRDLLFLDRLKRYADIGPLFLRVLTGSFLVYGVLDNVLSHERMQEFASFLESSRFPTPELLAPVSVYIQLVCGVALILGFLTRWVGILIAVHFVVAVIMVHWTQDFRGWWPAIVLVAIGFHFALTGAGRLSVDELFVGRTRS